MKKQTIFFLVMGLMTLNVFSQSNAEVVDYYQSVFGMVKKDMVSGFMDLEGYAEAEYWELYDQYETARKELGNTRIKLLETYANSYMNLDDAKTDEIINSMVTQKKKLDKLIVNYYKKIKKSVGSKPAAQFYQIENYILIAIRLDIMENIPFIGEIE